MSAVTIKDGFVNTAVGRLHYQHAGSGRAMVLLHSNGSSAYEYEAVLADLGRHFHVYAWDMPGHGDSDPLTKHGNIEFYSDALLSFMDALMIEKATILGSSVGGVIGTDSALRYADRIERLVIVETLLRSEPDWAKGWNRIEQLFAIPYQDFDAVAPRLRNLTPEMLVRWNIDRSKAGGKTMTDVMWAIRQYDMERELPGLTVPTMIMFGDKGPAMEFRNAFSRAMPDAEQVVIDDSGHFPMVDDPDGFVTAVLEFAGYS